MSTSLPERRDLDQLRRRAEELAEAFVAASVEGRPREAEGILDAHPDLARFSLEAAVVLGDFGQLAERLAVDPAAVVAIDADRGWPPLLYACYSSWHQIDPGRARGLVEVVRLLLGAGASPDTNNGARQGYRSALKGAVELNNPDLARVLLEAGADPDRGRPLVDAAGLRDHRCLELLLCHGAEVVAGTWTVGAAVFADDAGAVSALLGALEGGDGRASREATEALPDAAAEASVEVVAALLAAGADPDAHDDDRGMSALRRAVRAGKIETAALLVSSGAADDSTDIDHLLEACRRADREAAERILAEHPELRALLTGDDSAAVVEAAGSAPSAVVGLMLELGFPPDARDDSGAQPLHAAAYAGNADTVRRLIAAGAEVDGRDARFDATPLAFATVGSGERAAQSGNWIEVVRSLVDAGASRDRVWISAKAPSEEVIELLRGYGIAPDDELSPGPDDDPAPGPDDDRSPPASLGTGVMAEIARRLEAAYRDGDLELLGSLLHPDVHWTGVCTTSGEVLEWYRGLLAEGIESGVDSVEVDGDAVVLGLRVSRRAEGARAAPPELLYQVFTVDDGLVVDIRVYPDRSGALTRPAR